MWLIGACGREARLYCLRRARTGAQSEHQLQNALPCSSSISLAPSMSISTLALARVYCEKQHKDWRRSKEMGVLKTDQHHNIAGKKNLWSEV